MDTDKKIPGTGRGTGRKLGSKNLVTGQAKRDVQEFFKTLTVDSLRWRQNVKRHLEMAHDAHEFRFWSRIALEYGFGTPAKMTPAVAERQGLFFVSSRGIPWRHDPLAQKEREMLEAQARDDARDAEQRSLEAARPPAEGPDDEGGETLELVRNPGDR